MHNVKVNYGEAIYCGCRDTIEKPSAEWKIRRVEIARDEVAEIVVIRFNPLPRQE